MRYVCLIIGYWRFKTESVTVAAARLRWIGSFKTTTSQKIDWYRIPLLAGCANGALFLVMAQSTGALYDMFHGFIGQLIMRIRTNAIE